jgi:hypothetical protein
MFGAETAKNLPTGAGGGAAAMFGTVVGRVSPEVLCVLADSGWTVTLRVPVELGMELQVGRRAQLFLGPDGWPGSLGLIGG